MIFSENFSSVENFLEWNGPLVKRGRVSRRDFGWTHEKKSCTVQWRNVISGPPGSKFSKAPLVEVLKARVVHRICTSFLGGPGHFHTENFWIYTLWNAISWTLGRDFTEFWWSENDIVTYQRPWPMFLLYRLNLGAPIWPIEVGGPRVLPVWAHNSYATDTVHDSWWELTGDFCASSENFHQFSSSFGRSLRRN